MESDYVFCLISAQVFSSFKQVDCAEKFTDPIDPWILQLVVFVTKKHCKLMMGTWNKNRQLESSGLRIQWSKDRRL